MATYTYKCPNCDGGLQFDPETQKFSCEFCQSQFAEQELECISEQARESPRGQTPPETQPGSMHTVCYSCPACGAQIVTDETTAATFCYYCHNPVVLAGRLEGDFAPDKLIPFQLDRDEAAEKLLAWAHSKKFVPRAFFRKEQIETITGVYFPYWSADCELQGHLDATAHNIRVWRSGNVEYTETQDYRVSRCGSASFGGITKTALQTENAKLVESVQPYDESGMIDFSMPYLAGFQANQRNVSCESLRGEIETETQRFCESLLRDTIRGYDRVTNCRAHVNLTQIDWKYVLLPVWVLTYPGKNNKLYHYAINGQTGQIRGQLPIDLRKLSLFSLLLAAAVFLLLLIGGALL